MIIEQYEDNIVFEATKMKNSEMVKGVYLFKKTQKLVLSDFSNNSWKITGTRLSELSISELICSGDKDEYDTMKKFFA